MKRRKVDNSLEKQFVTAMVTSTPFLLLASDLIDVSLFQTAYTKKVAGWCLDYFKTYGKAAGKTIESIYHAWVEKDKPEEEESEAISDFLGNLSSLADAAPEVNERFLADELISYLTLRRASLLSDTIQTGLMRGDVEGIKEAVFSFEKVDLQADGSYTPLKGKALRKLTFSTPQESLIEYPGDAGRFFNSFLTRESLVGIQAPEKSGKSFWCADLAFRGLRHRRKVAIFQVGDMSNPQYAMRLATRISGIPVSSSDRAKTRYPKTIEVVYDGKDTSPDVEFITKSFSRPLTSGMLKDAQRLFNRRYVLQGNELRVSCHASGTINVRGIDAILKRWRDTLDWVPDVIVIDYADILAPEDGKLEFRHQVNETWKALRRLSQEWHALVIAPTQANASTYDGKTQKRKSFSEDKRKYAHVTAMLGLNWTEEEQDMQVQRLNWILVREGTHSSSKCLWVAQCLPLGMAFVKGTYAT